MSCGTRAIVPSSFMISQITPAGVKPANRARSTEPSVWPVRSRTPPARARKGKMWPGRTKSSGLVLGLTTVRTVVARSAAEMPVVTPRRASIETMNAVPKGEVLSISSTMGGICNSARRSEVSDKQMSPRPYLVIKLIASGVTFSAAMVKSPSFSRSSSSTRMTIFPCRMSSMASSIVWTGIPLTPPLPSATCLQELTTSVVQ